MNEYKAFLLFIIIIFIAAAIGGSVRYRNDTDRMEKCIHAGMEFVDGDCVSTFR